MPALPSDLEPRFWDQDYTITKSTNNIRAEKFNGIARQRRKTATYSDRISGKVMLTDVLLQSWESFFYDTLNHGETPFDCPIYDGSGRRIMEVTIAGGMFTKQQRGPSHWMVSLDVVCAERKPVYPGQLDLIIQLDRELIENTGRIIDDQGNTIVDDNANQIIYREFS